MSFPKIFRYMMICCWLIFLLSACHNNKKHPSSHVTDTATVRRPVPASPTTHSREFDLQRALNSSGMAQWKQSMKQQFPDFSAKNFQPESKEKAPSASMTPYDSQTWATFRPYFIVSPNRKYAADLHSYSDFPTDIADTLETGEADQAVNLVNLSEQTKKQILFAGPGTIFQQAEWINDTILIITGQSDANLQNKRLPVSWMYTLRSDSISTYRYAPKDTL